jgi:hypothetical protein
MDQTNRLSSRFLVFLLCLSGALACYAFGRQRAFADVGGGSSCNQKCVVANCFSDANCVYYSPAYCYRAYTAAAADSVPCITLTGSTKTWACDDCDPDCENTPSTATCGNCNTPLSDAERTDCQAKKG